MQYILLFKLCNNKYFSKLILQPHQPKNKPSNFTPKSHIHYFMPFNKICSCCSGIVVRTLGSYDVVPGSYLGFRVRLSSFGINKGVPSILGKLTDG